MNGMEWNAITFSRQSLATLRLERIATRLCVVSCTLICRAYVTFSKNLMFNKLFLYLNFYQKNQKNKTKINYFIIFRRKLFVKKINECVSVWEKWMKGCQVRGSVKSRIVTPNPSPATTVSSSSSSSATTVTTITIITCRIPHGVVDTPFQKLSRNKNFFLPLRCNEFARNAKWVENFMENVAKG